LIQNGDIYTAAEMLCKQIAKLDCLHIFL